MKVLREFESHRFRQLHVSSSLKQSLKPAQQKALAGFLLLKRYQVESVKLCFLLVNLLVYGNLLQSFYQHVAKSWR